MQWKLCVPIWKNKVPTYFRHFRKYYRIKAIFIESQLYQNNEMKIFLTVAYLLSEMQSLVVNDPVHIFQTGFVHTINYNTKVLLLTNWTEAILNSCFKV